MYYRKLANYLLVPFAGAIILLGSATFAAAQRGEYNEWQEAVRDEQEELREYQMNPTRKNYREWQRARVNTQRQWAKYQEALREEGRYATYPRTVTYPRRTVVTYPQTGMYRVNWGGRYYNYNQAQYNLLRQAVNRGYQQGYRAGLQDRRFGRGYNYYNNTYYRTGTFGYVSYVPRDAYSYYFQQGFQRGYEDGYYSRVRYGYRSGNTYNILGSVLNTILNVARAVDDDDDWDDYR